MAKKQKKEKKSRKKINIGKQKKGRIAKKQKIEKIIKKQRIGKVVKKPRQEKKQKKKIIAKKQKQEYIGKEVGKITHYYTDISVGVIDLSDTLKAGDKIRIKGATTDFEQKVESMQIEHEKVNEAKAGKSIGLKVKDHVREHDKVYKL